MPPGDEPRQAGEPTIRLAHPGDAGPLCQLYAELLDNGTGSPPATVDLARQILTELADESARRLLVAEVEDQRIVGTADVVIVTNLTHGGHPWAVVENVVVAADCRRRGIGRALMVEAIRSARRAGCYKVQLTSAKERSGAHAFYRSLGFEALAEGFKVYFDT